MMKSKRIYRTLIRKNLTRHFLLCILSFIALFLQVVIIIDFTNTYMGTYGDPLREWKAQVYGFESFRVGDVLLSVVLPLCTFSFLHSKKEDHFFHSIPATKNELFLGSLLSGFLLYALPWFLITVLTTPFIIHRTGGDSLYWGSFLQGLILRLGTYTIAYSISVLAMVLCGRRFFAVLCVVALHFIFPITEIILRSIIRGYLYGIPFQDSTFLLPLSPILYFSEIYDYRDIPWLALGLYTGVSFVLMYLSLFLYRRRKEEYVGQSLIFPKLLSVAQYFLTFFLAYFFAGLLLMIFPISDDSVSAEVRLFLYLTPISFFLSRMLLFRTTKVFQKKAFLQYSIFILCFLGYILSFKHDLFGIVRRVPEVEDVRILHIRINDMEYVTEDPRDIADFITVHNKMIQKGPQLPIETRGDLYEVGHLLPFKIVDIVYETDGKDLHRQYTLYAPSAVNKEILAALEHYFRTDDRGFDHVRQLQESAVSVVFSVSDESKDMLDSETISLSSAEQEIFFQSLLQDMKDGSHPLIFQLSSDTDIIRSNVWITIRTKDDLLYFGLPMDLETTINFLVAQKEAYQSTP